MHLEPKAAHQGNNGHMDSELGHATTGQSQQGLMSGGAPIGRQISVTLSASFHLRLPIEVSPPFYPCQSGLTRRPILYSARAV